MDSNDKMAQDSSGADRMAPAVFKTRAPRHPDTKDGSPKSPVSSSALPPSSDRLPVLTEVVSAGLRPEPLTDRDIHTVTGVRKSPPPPTLSDLEESLLIQSVLLSLQKQTDRLVDFRVRELMEPVLQNMVNHLVKDIQMGLQETIKDVVAKAVAQELAKQRQRIGTST